MKTKIFLIIGLFISQLAYSQDSIEEYISKYKDIAIQEMVRTGIPAAITLAQGIVESHAGNGDLVKISNNHFGIKCKKNWTGKTVKHDDDKPCECFRKYDSAEESFIDHSDFLKTRDNYAFLFQLNPIDYEKWAYGIKKAGYATNPNYPALLIKYIEKYDLNQYTKIGIEKKYSYKCEIMIASIDNLNDEIIIAYNQ
jgi:flagellum-specific peptidoglycan hydrolase FlgJ